MASPTTKSVTMNFEDPSGAPIANGRVEIWLTYDIALASSGGIQVAAGKKITVPLNGSGSCTVTLFVNSSLVPVGSQYHVKAYTSLGQPCWDEIMVVTP